MTTASTQAARTLAKLGASKGGKASAAKLTPAQRKKRARKAALARWKWDGKRIGSITGVVFVKDEDSAKPPSRLCRRKRTLGA